MDYIYQKEFNHEVARCNYFENSDTSNKIEFIIFSVIIESFGFLSKFEVWQK